MSTKVKLREDHERLVTLERPFADLARPLVAVCRVGKEWLLAHKVDDLRVDGWECLRIRDVRGVSRGAHEPFAERVLGGEKALDQHEHPDVDLDDAAGLLRGLRGRPMVTWECEADGAFLLGTILRVGRRSAVIHPVGANGVWFRHAVRVALEDITRVAAADHYGRMFERYARVRPRVTRVKDRAKA